MGNAYKSVLASGGAVGTQITPSNSNPPTLTSGNTYEITGNNGAAVKEIIDITPANSSSAPSLSTDTIYKTTTSGKAIKATSTGVTPSSSGTSFSQGWNYMTQGGWAYSPKPSSGISLRQLTARLTSSRAYAFMYFDTSGKSTVSVGTLQSQATSSLKFFNSSDVQIGTVISVTSNGSYTIPDGSSYCEFAVSTGTSGSTSYGLSNINIS